MKRLSLLLTVLAGMACADPAQDALAALDQLEDASAQLDAAKGGADRVKALTATVQALEGGLSAVRVGLRAVVQREATLSQQLDAKEAEVGRLIGVLQIMARAPEQQLLLHPLGPMGSARSGMILSDVTPALQAEVDTLRADLSEVEALRTLQQDAEARLRKGLTDVQDARASLAQAIADREPLPKRFSADPVQIAVLIGAAETLDGFAQGLADFTATDPNPDLPTARRLRGTLPFPAQGTLLRSFNEADAAGVERPGIILATRPLALVAAPTAATVRFQGPLLDYGNVMILEPAQEVLMVLAGLNEVYVTIGDVVAAGDPIGLMGSGNAGNRNTERSETLYIEIRDGQDAVDPLPWFAGGRN